MAILIIFLALSGLKNPLKDLYQLQKNLYRPELPNPSNRTLSPWNWNFIGPQGGVIINCMSHPNATNLAFALSARDVWRTTDGGANWSLSFENCFPNGGMMTGPSSALIVDGGGVVWLTLDGGTIWSQVLPTTNFQTASFDVIDTVIYLADSIPPRLWRSTNRGLTWQVVTTFPSLYSIDAIAHIPGAPGAYWLVGHTTPNDTLSYIYFSPVSAFVDTIPAHEVFDFQQNPWNMWHTLIATDGGIYQATSGLGPWSLLNEPFLFGLYAPQDIEFTGNDTIVVSSMFESGIFVGRRQNGIWTFTRTENREIGTGMSPGAPATLYCGSLGKGVYKTTDDGYNWNILRNNLYAQTLMGPGNASRILPPAGYFIEFGGTCYKSTDWGATWDTLPRNFLVYGAAIEVAPTNPNFLIVSAMDVEVVGTTISFGTIFTSSDGGVNWSKVDSNYRPNDFLITSNPNIIIGLCDTFLIRSTEGGLNFTPVFYTHNTLFSLTGIDTIFVATPESVFVSYDQGATWTGLLGLDIGGELAYDNIRKILYMAANPIYRYNLQTAILDSLNYYGLVTDVTPNGNLYFLHYIPDTVFIARSFNGGDTIEQEVFPIPHIFGGLRAGDSVLFYYEGLRGLWRSTDITSSIAEGREFIFKNFQISLPTFLKKGTEAAVIIRVNGKKKFSVVIYDIAGRLIDKPFNGTINHERRIRFSTKKMNRGVYFVLFKLEKEIDVKKVIVY